MTAEGDAAATAARWGAVMVIALACVVVACGFAVAAPASEPQAGYWWKPEPVSGLIPVPGVPPNGLYIASSPTGPQAFSAIRFDVADKTAMVRLTLHVSPQEQVGRAAVIAYPATGNWQTSGPQAWSARPSYRTTTKPITGVFQGRELMTLTFPAREAASGIVLLPDPNAPNKTFTVAFTPPHAADVSIRSTATSPPSTPSSARPSHHPKPTKTAHSASPSARPTHSHKTHKSSTSPSAAARPTTAPSPTTGPSTSSPPVSATAESDQGHGARTALLIVVPIALVLILFVSYRVAASRRRPGNEA